MKKKILSLALAAGMSAMLLPTVACAASQSYTEQNATLIAFSDDAVTASGAYSGYEIDGTAVSITEAGTYVLSGACADGSVTVKKEVTGVTLVLDGLDLSSVATSPITINKSAEATLLAAAGSENTVADSADANDENAAIKVKTGASLTMGGTGALRVDGNYKNGIKGAAQAAITVDELALTIDAVDDGLSCDDALTILGGTLDITAGGDAVKASPDVDSETEPDTVSRGDITISGGTLTLVSAADGVQADGDLTISGGTFDITANGGHETVLAEDADSCKGLKADGMLSVTGGTFAIDSADDAIHAPDVAVTGGSFTLATSDDAIHADNALTVGAEGNDAAVPAIVITDSTEGLEGTTVTVYSGDLDITASDDGVNAANSDIGERSDLFAIQISGGDLYICAGADGLDSNNDIDMTGGTVEVYGADAGMDTAIDYDGTFTLSGGTLLGAGMTPPDDADGERPTRPDGMGGGMQAENMLGISEGSTVAIQDADGNTLYETTAAGRMSGVIFSSAAVSEGESYTLLVDGETVQTVQAVLGSSNDPGMGGQPSDGSGFRDVQADAWYADAVQYVVFKGLMNGTDAATFSPDTPMSRAMLVTVLYRLSGEPAVSQDSGFADVASDAYYADAVSWAVGEGIVTGTSQTTFSPDESVTREQMAVLLYRCAGEPSTAGDLSAYADAENISDYAAEAMSWCVENGILSGTDGGRLAPAASATRAETAAVLQRFAAL